MIPLILWVLFLSRTVIAPFVFAFFLAYAINPLVDFFQKKGAPRDWAIITVYLMLFLIFALVIVIIIPRLLHDLTGALQKLPDLFASFQKYEDRFSSIYWQLPVNVKSVLLQINQRLELILRNSLVKMAQGMVELFSQSVIYLLVPLLAYYISRDYPQIKQNIYRWIKAHFGSIWTETFLKIDSVLRLYIRAQLLDTIIVGALIGLGLSILGFDTAFLLGLIAGFLNLIPYFGPVLGAIPSVVFGLLKSPWVALYVVGLFILVNQIEVMFLAPRIIGGNLKLNPVLVVYLIVVGGKLFGIIGMVFAVPLGAIILIIFSSIYEICFGPAKKESSAGKLEFNNSDLD